MASHARSHATYNCTARSGYRESRYITTQVSSLIQNGRTHSDTFRSRSTTLPDAVFVDDSLDFIDIPHSAYLNLYPRLRSGGNANPPHPQNPLKECLLNLHVSYIAVPYLGDRTTQPTTMKTCSQIRDSQFSASASEKPDHQDRNPNSHQGKSANQKKTERTVSKH